MCAFVVLNYKNFRKNFILLTKYVFVYKATTNVLQSHRSIQNTLKLAQSVM